MPARAPLAALVLALAPLAFGQSIQVGRGDDSADVKKAADELQELEKRIERQDIPPVEFDFGKATLKPEAKDALEFVADVMLRHPDLKLMVAGHTDDVGSERYNQWLSQKRAEAVKDYLVRLGVLGESVRAKGFGDKKPLVDNDSEEDRAKNRRVEFILMKRWWDSVF